MKCIAKVFETTKYENFKYLKGNREPNKAHVKRLEQSFQEQYLISPITVNENFEIIDGQHRFEAAKNLKLPIYYTMLKGYKLKEVQRLNTNMKEWKKTDYLDSYASLGYKEYIKFKKFMAEFPMFSLACCEVLLKNSIAVKTYQNKEELASSTNQSGRIKIKDFQNGNFKIADYDLAVKNAYKILQFKQYYEGYTRRSFIAAMVQIFKNKNYDHEVMIQRMKNPANKLENFANITQYKQAIQKIYNHTSRKKVSLIYG